jgi:alanyl-tRNA synthetase
VLKAIVTGDREASTLGEGGRGTLVFNQTPFYGEAGGQTGDHGIIRTASGAEFWVEGTERRLGDLIIHSGMVQKGTIKVGDAAELEVNHFRRSGNRQHHSATHLLHEALRQVLGGHVAQKGSLVEPSRLRFDFSHNKAMTPKEIEEVEQIANDAVLQNDPVVTRLMSVDEAIAEGAMALFGEKYGDEVRVVSMGRNAPGSNRPAYSLELCGGTHVGRTGDIGIIRIVSESASAAGVRRIEAFAGNVARHYLDTQDKRLHAVAAALKVTPAEAADRVEALIEERRKFERDLSEARKQLAMGGGAKQNGGITDVSGIKFMSRVMSGVDPKDLKSLADEGKKAVGSGVVALVAVSEDGKGAVVVGVTDDLTKRYSAIDLVRTGSAALGGKGGGGRPDMAQAGGPDGAKAEAALDAIKQAVAVG